MTWISILEPRKHIELRLSHWWLQIVHTWENVCWHLYELFSVESVIKLYYKWWWLQDGKMLSIKHVNLIGILCVVLYTRLLMNIFLKTNCFRFSFDIFYRFTISYYKYVLRVINNKYCRHHICDSPFGLWAINIQFRWHKQSPHGLIDTKSHTYSPMHVILMINE